MDITEELIAAAAARVVAADGAVTYKEREVSFAPPFARAHHEGRDRCARRAAAGLALDARATSTTPARLAAWTRSDALARPAQRARARPSARSATRASRTASGSPSSSRTSPSTRFWDPTFVIDYPTEVSPLAKARPTTRRPRSASSSSWRAWRSPTASRELNDPLEQRERFLDQLKEREKGDVEAHQMDDDYVRALGHGLPPTGGCGVGIDRLAMVLTDSPSIRDVILFPHMRPGGRPLACRCRSSCASRCAT